VAAAGAALERNGSSKDSGDEMSLDSDAEEGSNVEMGGMSDGRTGTDGGAKKVPRKRKMKEDEYDKDDGFVDDSELLWEEQAAAANDGFFVYSGPLVPEGEKPNVDSRYVKFPCWPHHQRCINHIQSRWPPETRTWPRVARRCQSFNRAWWGQRGREGLAWFAPLWAWFPWGFDDTEAAYH
jgi:hypothetical protein